MDFYYFPPSAPCRSVEMCAKAVGVELNKKFLDLMAGEHLKPEFIAINPQHCVPTIVDDGLTIWESRPILIYLAEKYDQSGSLYPKVPKVKAVINQRLYFDTGVFFKSFSEYYIPMIIRQLPADPTKFPAIETAFDLLETFLTGKLYVADTDTYTIADIALLSSMTNFDVVGFDYSKYPNVAKWYANCKQVVPGYAENVAACRDTSYFKPKQ